MHESWKSTEESELSDFLSHLEESWTDSGLKDVQNEQVYKSRAVTMVTNAYNLKVHGKMADDLRFESELSGARVKVSADCAFEDQDTSELTIVRYKSGKPKKDDHTDKRLALMRHAAQNPGKNVNIQLQYLGSGEVVDVKPNPRYDPDRVQKYVLAVQGIQNHQFDPTPGRECRTCPYMLICDRKVD
jgi:CRISPR/Cas system-associated exonuclease Cas4 (RecB family)